MDCGWTRTRRDWSSTPWDGSWGHRWNWCLLQLALALPHCKGREVMCHPVRRQRHSNGPRRQWRTGERRDILQQQQQQQQQQQ